MKIKLLTALFILCLIAPAFALEDFTTYTETDPSSEINNINETYYDADGPGGDHDTYLYKDKGAGNITTTFICNFTTVYSSSSGNWANSGFFAISNEVNDIANWQSDNDQAIVCQFDRTDTATEFYSMENCEDDNYTSYVSDLAGGTTHYHTVQGNGTHIKWTAYTDAGRSSEFMNLTVAVNASNTYQYFFAVVGTNEGFGNRVHTWDGKDYELTLGAGEEEPASTTRMLLW